MGSKNQKIKKNQNLKYHEREFDDMKKRIMNDSNNRNYGYNRNNGYDNHETTTDDSFVNTGDTASNYNRENKVNLSRTRDFTDMIKELVNLNTTNNVEVKLLFGNKKVSNGIVFVKMNISSNTSDNVGVSNSETVIFYYTEDQSVNPKKKRFLKNYMGSVMVINQSSGNVLFNRFGYDCVEKSRAYIENIIQKTINRVGNVNLTKEERHRGGNQVSDLPQENDTLDEAYVQRDDVFTADIADSILSMDAIDLM